MGANRAIAVAIAVALAVVLAIALFTSDAAATRAMTPSQAVALGDKLGVKQETLEGPSRITGKLRQGWPKLILEHCDTTFVGLGRKSDGYAQFMAWVCDTPGNAKAVVVLLDRIQHDRNAASIFTARNVVFHIDTASSAVLERWKQILQQDNGRTLDSGRR